MASELLRCGLGLLRSALNQPPGGQGGSRGAAVKRGWGPFDLRLDGQLDVLLGDAELEGESVLYRPALRTLGTAGVIGVFRQALGAVRKVDERRLDKAKIGEKAQFTGCK